MHYVENGVGLSTHTFEIAFASIILNGSTDGVRLAHPFVMVSFFFSLELTDLFTSLRRSV